MDLETANELTNSPVVKKYIENIDAYAERRSRKDSNIGGMSDYPSHFISEYKADGAALTTPGGISTPHGTRSLLARQRTAKRPSTPTRATSLRWASSNNRMFALALLWNTTSPVSRPCSSNSSWTSLSVPATILKSFTLSCSSSKTAEESEERGQRSRASGSLTSRSPR